VKVDPEASLRIWAVEVIIGDRTFEIPALPASVWFPVLAGGQPADVLDLIMSNPDDPDNLDDFILTGTVTGEDLTSAISDTVEEVTGRPPHVAYILARVAELIWPTIGGELALRGFRWDTASIGAALDAIYTVAMSRLTKEGAEKLDSVLNRPAPGQKMDRERALADFEAMAGPKPTTGARSGGAHPKTRQPRKRVPPAVP
jgi:hypothetical protein